MNLDLNSKPFKCVETRQRNSRDIFLTLKIILIKNVWFIIWHLPSFECFTLHHPAVLNFLNFQWQKLFERWYAISKLVGLWIKTLLFSNFTFMSIRLACGGWTLANPLAVEADCWASLWESESIVLDVPTLGAWLWPMRLAPMQGGSVLRRIKG